MANLVSPGVSVTVTDESFFVPVAAATVPLVFIATADEKMRPDNVTPAAGTFEHDVVRVVTSLTQSVELYGVPRFLRTSSGEALHGDARNEYGLFALNQFLGIGNMAYVVRANVNLNDSLVDIRTMWDNKMQESAFVLENLVNAFLNEYNQSNHFIPTTVDAVNSLVSVVPGTGYTNGTYLNVPFVGGSGVGASGNVVISGGNVTSVVIVNRGVNYTVGDVLSVAAANLGGTGTGFSVNVASLTGFKETVNKATLISLINSATTHVWEMFSFRNSTASFMTDVTHAPLNVYANGYDQTSTGTFLGVNGDAENWVINGLGGIESTEWTAAEASGLLLSASDAFKFTVEFLNQTSLGANDAARRVAIVTALQATINSNADVRSESVEYNLILCPGYHEVADEMLNLRVDIKEEAMVISDPPMNLNPEDVVVWSATVARRSSPGIVYYYPHSLASNLDGFDVVAASSGTALRTFAYSDEVSALWFAPAGTRRGLVSGVNDVGFVSGTLGSSTTFSPVALNQGQRDNLYKFFTNINPIVFFPGRGIIVWGQKTSSPDASARDRVNVERLIQYIRRQLRKNLMPFTFEPNDPLTRDTVHAVVTGFLSDLISRRGLYDFAVQVDEGNNTPTRVDRNELWVDIAIKPVKAIEFIYVPIRVVNTGTEIN